MINELIMKWKLNRALLASKIGMPQSTFNNKLNPKHFTSFNKKEIELIKVILSQLKDELDQYHLIEHNNKFQVKSILLNPIDACKIKRV